MAPRKPKVDDDTASTTSTEPLKPKNEKSKITKAAKTAKPKIEKADKPKAVKKEKTDAGDGEKAEKPRLVKKPEMGGKEKVKAASGNEAVELMVEYLKGQNRPYSATDVSANLHGKVTKTVADKLLKEMEQNGQIMGKATKKDGGGQWVFWAIQDPADAASPAELATMESTIDTLRETIPILKSNLKVLNSKLSALLSAPTTADLAIMIENMKNEKEEKGRKLEGFKNGSAKMVTKDEMDKTEKEFKYWTGKRSARKRAFENLEALLLDGMTRDEIWDKVGIEGDVM